MVSSRGSVWPLDQAAANTSSPSASRAAATERSCSARLAGGGGQPLSSRRAAAAEPRCPFHPPLRDRYSRSNLASSACGENSLALAAASSIASGSPSSLRQICATAAAFVSVSSKVGETALAR
jgi:predicted phage gp36 major capsid-like protein